MAKAKTTIKKITQNAWECTKIFKTGEIEKRIVMLFERASCSNGTIR